MKKLVIPESELTNIIQKAVEKKLIEQDFTIEPQISKTPRETELENVSETIEKITNEKN